jgi:hypothetical protein
VTLLLPPHGIIAMILQTEPIRTMTQRPRSFYVEMGKRRAAQIPKNPIMACILCLYRVGFGYTTIGKITDTNKSLCRKWVKRAGFERGFIKRSKPLFITGKGNRLTEADEKEKEFVRNLKRSLGVSRSEFKLPRQYWKKKYRHKPEFRARSRAKAIEYYNRNREKVLAKQKQAWIIKKQDPELLAKRYQKNRQYRKANSGKLKVINREWRQRNPQKIRGYRAKQREDPIFRITHGLRARVRDFVKGVRFGGTSGLVGCSRDQLRDWIQAKFKRGMSWDNYGKWHIDHRTPCAVFDLTRQDEVRRCFHYSNLQPLWAHENCEKSDSVTSKNAQPELVLDLA